MRAARKTVDDLNAVVFSCDDVLAGTCNVVIPSASEIKAQTVAAQASSKNVAQLARQLARMRG